MNRRVITGTPQGVGGPNLDSFSARVVKYIPAEVVAAWITVSSLMKPSSTTTPPPEPDYTVMWIVFAVFLVLTALWTWRTTQVPGAPVAKTQILISMVSFAVWVFALSGPFASIKAIAARPALGGIALIIWTLVAGLIVPPPSEGQVAPA